MPRRQQPRHFILASLASCEPRACTVCQFRFPSCPASDIGQVSAPSPGAQPPLLPASLQPSVCSRLTTHESPSRREPSHHFQSLVTWRIALDRILSRQLLVVEASSLMGPLWTSGDPHQRSVHSPLAQEIGSRQRGTFQARYPWPPGFQSSSKTATLGLAAW